MIREARSVDSSATKQDFCAPTTDFILVDRTELPYLAAASTGRLAIAPYGRVWLHEPKLTMTLASDRQSFGGGTFTAIAPTWPIDEGYYDGKKTGAACDSLALDEAPCFACPEGVKGEYCFQLAIASLEGHTVPLSLLPVEGDQCPGCDPGPPEDVSETCAD